jgi:hypothetical protein
MHDVSIVPVVKAIISGNEFAAVLAPSRALNHELISVNGSTAVRSVA